MKTAQETYNEVYNETFGYMPPPMGHWAVTAMNRFADQEKQALKEKLDDAVAVLKKLNRAINQSNMKSTILHSEVRKVLRDNKVTPE